MWAQIGMTVLFVVLILPALLGLASSAMRSPGGNGLLRLVLLLAPVIGGFYFLTWVW